MKSSRSSGGSKRAHPAAVLAALSDQARLKTFCAVVLGAGEFEAIARSADLSPQRAKKALERLVEAGLLVVRDGAFAAVSTAFSVALEKESEASKEVFHGVDAKTAAELRKFFRAGKLTHIPEPRPKRLLVLNYLATVFEPGVYYPERQVNALLRRFHPDSASLRRFLVDEGFLDRKAGRYWRTGGTIPME